MRPVLVALLLVPWLAPAAVDGGPSLASLQAVRLEPFLQPDPNLYLVTSLPTSRDSRGFAYNDFQCLDPAAAQPSMRRANVLSPWKLQRVSTTTEGAFFEIRTGIASQTQTGFWSCENALDGGTRLPSTLPFAAQNGVGVESTPLMSPGGRVCYVVTEFPSNGKSKGRVDCFHPGQPSPLRETVLDSDSLDARLGIVPWTETWNPWAPVPLIPGSTACAGPCPYLEKWIFRDGAFTHDGRLFLLAQRGTIYVRGVGDDARALPTRVDYLLELVSDGGVDVVRGPPGPLHADHSGDPLTRSEGHLFPDRRHGTLLIGPLREPEYSHEDTGRVAGANSDRGPGGLGFVVVPLDQPGAGLLSVTDAYARAIGCVETVAGNSVVPCAWNPSVGATPEGPSLDESQLELKADLLDLDQDGLLTHEELDAGTSPYAWDTDHGGSPDAVELALGTSPTDSSDDLDGRAAPRLVAASSPLIRLVVPEALRQVEGFEESLAPHGPLCANGRCWDRRFNEVGRYATATTDQRSRRGVVAADGVHLGLLENGALISVHLATGLRSELASSAALALEFGKVLSSSERWYLAPVDGDHAFVVVPADPARVVYVERGQPPRRVFDLEQTWCGSSPACGFHQPRTNTDDPTGQLRLVGFHAPTGMLLLGIDTTWRAFLVGVPSAGPARVLDVNATWLGIPDHLWPFGPERYFWTEHESGDHRLPPDFEGPMWTTGLGSVLIGVDSVTVASGPYAPAWGDSLLFTASLTFFDGTSSNEGVRRPFEMVLLDQERMQPGEVLFFGNFNGGQWYRGGQKGGIVRTEKEPLPEWQRPTGMALGRRGTDWVLCQVTPEHMLVRELGSLAPGAMPTPIDERWRARVEDPVDCAYDEQNGGRLLVLRKNGTVVARTEAGALVEEPALVGAAPAEYFFRQADGRLAVFSPTGDVLGVGVTRDGKRMTLHRDADLTLTVGDKSLKLKAALAANGYATEGPYAITFITTKLLARGDGRIVLAHPHGPFLVDLETGRIAAYSNQGSIVLTGLALVPGEMQDPWGQPTAAPSAATPPGDPPRVTAPIGGTKLEGPTGCGCHSVPGTSLMASLALLAWWRRRRRR